MNKNIKLASICLVFLGVGLMTGCGGGLRGDDAEVAADRARCAQYNSNAFGNVLLGGKWNIKEQGKLCEEANCFFRAEPAYHLESLWRSLGTCVSFKESCDQFEISNSAARPAILGMTPEQACEKAEAGCEVFPIVGSTSECVEKGTLVDNGFHPSPEVCSLYSPGFFGSFDTVSCHNAGCLPFGRTAIVPGACYSYDTPCSESFGDLCFFLPHCEYKKTYHWNGYYAGRKCFDKAS